MNIYYGLKNDYKPIRNEVTRIVISYGMKNVDEANATWHEIIFYKKQHPIVTFDNIKEAILSDINAQTDEKILKGFIWENKNVWLSSENQFNFKAAYDLAVQTQGVSLPVKFKLGENTEGDPIYHTFEDMEEFTDFYTKAIAYINQCLNDGWQMKDGIDWSEYEPFVTSVSNEGTNSVE